MQQPAARWQTSSDHFCPPGQSQLNIWDCNVSVSLILRQPKCFPRQQVVKLRRSESESSCVQTEEEGAGEGGGGGRRMWEEERCALPGRPCLESLCSGRKYYDQLNHQLNRTRPSAAENQGTVWVCAICTANIVQMMQTCMRWRGQKTECKPCLASFHAATLAAWFFSPFFSFLNKRDSLWSSKGIPLLPSVSWLEDIKWRSRLLGLLFLWNLTLLFANVGPFSAPSQETSGPLENPLYDGQWIWFF